MDLLVAIFYSKIVQLLLHPVVGVFSRCPPNLFVEFSFVFWNVLFCLYLIVLLLPVLSSLYPQVMLLFFLVWLFPFFPNIFQHFFISLIILPVSVAFFSAFPIKSSIHVLIFFVLFEGTMIFSQTSFAPV